MTEIIITFDDGAMVKFKPTELTIKNVHLNINDEGEYYCFDELDFCVEHKIIPDHLDRLTELEYYYIQSVEVITENNSYAFHTPSAKYTSTNSNKTYTRIEFYPMN